ncbi:hypothetical protein AVEN_165204-1 [Araneus ventricosus]|uniref:Uncharacterized protein n=1 Tax=Araneus ventricosus TaxID=182803 RepID=A0A4Y2B5J8_ARAVE|nr:hypothetical protein AVEN_165204-1 [Araneus ventricosus]
MDMFTFDKILLSNRCVSNIRPSRSPGKLLVGLSIRVLVITIDKKSSKPVNWNLIYDLDAKIADLYQILNPFGQREVIQNAYLILFTVRRS